MRFFKTFLAALSAIVAFFLLIILVFTAVGAMGDKEFVVEENSVLHLKLDQPITDRYVETPFKFDQSTFQTLQLEGLDRILNQVAKAKVDPRIDGIFLDAISPMAGLATLQEIREALADFRSSGKWVVSYADTYSQAGYYLASVSDEIYMQPEGAMELKGLNANVTFLKGMLDKVGVEVQVIRPTNNRFKSAVEPFILDSMSAANEEQLQQILNSIWSEMSGSMAESRGMNQQDFDEAVNKLSSRNGGSAVNAGLITAVKYRDEIDTMLRERCGTAEDEKVDLVSLSSYADVEADGYEDRTENFLASDKIAVIYASGEIGMGDETEEAIGSDGIASLVAKARKDDKIKAIVLRVNSPGGSALASDVIWREMSLAKEAKPVVVSMGDVAASGGYYISCNADKIFASETTITGSIGVFGMIPNTQELNEDILGINHDGVKTHQYADMMEINRPMRADEEALWQGAVDDIYTDFTTKVGVGRGVSQSYVDSIGQGRVWSGVDAMDIKLIDAYGGIEEAIAEAASLAELDDYRLQKFPESMDPIQRIIKDITGGGESDAMARLTQQDVALYSMIKRYQEIMRMKGIQARMPIILDID